MTLVSVDLRMAHLDNGFEQLFILPTEVGITQVPEPSTMAMFLAGSAWTRPIREASTCRMIDSSHVGI